MATTSSMVNDAFVEQDLIISRALVEIYQDPFLSDRLLFRGGTALYKLYLKPPARYSEDIDLVQANSEPIGDIIRHIRAVLDPWLGMPKWEMKEARLNIVYRYMSETEPPIRMRLKIETNTREHFSVLPVAKIPFCVKSRWFSHTAEISTYALNELLGTKLRALFQRKKGRDLFDLWFALNSNKIDSELIVRCFKTYLEKTGFEITRAQFEENLRLKSTQNAFRRDMEPIISPKLSWNFDQALEEVVNELICRIN